MGVVLDTISVWANGAIPTPFTPAIQRAPRSHAERMEQWRAQADKAIEGRKKNGVGRPVSIEAQRQKLWALRAKDRAWVRRMYALLLPAPRQVGRG